ncbi:DUF488 domain-containing protein [Methanobacterium aggregans]|uniref:DUF488 domain-containing protein n=1 Tax=Methanobacterium aggregans TaxID=1615586 RepID=UPI001FD9CDCD|nr:DUF488 family protein [Methanobacterium aggregans]MBP2045101.1 uncharacterized protein YeaO (DUF488 family) [Methanobacterium aggregans]
MITIKRAYLPPEEEDGFRVLVDRIWSRGVSKEDIKLDFWMKNVAPSNELRKWFAHDPERWLEFKTRYLDELKDKKELIAHLKIIEKFNKTLTLVYSAQMKNTTTQWF